MENLKISTCALYRKHVSTNMCWAGQAAELAGCISSLKKSSYTTPNVNDAK